MTASENQNKDILMLFVRADGMKSKSNKTGNIFGAADSFFEVLNERMEVVARSSVLFNDVTPKWPPIKLDLETLCENDDSKEVYISFYDHQPTQDHEWIDTIATTVHGLKQSARECQDQHNIRFSDKKPSHEFGDWVRVYIYDAIITTGVPTIGTLIKNKCGKAAKSKSIETATEVETLCSSENESSIDECIGRIIAIRSDHLMPPISKAGHAAQSHSDEKHEAVAGAGAIECVTTRSCPNFC